MSDILAIRNLELGFRSHAGRTQVLHGISLRIGRGERVALVGESGSGKSVTARIVLGLLQALPSAEIRGDLAFAGRDLNRLRADQWRALRGTAISTIFQDPTSSLNPVFTIGNQFTEVLKRADPRISEMPMRDGRALAPPILLGLRVDRRCRPGAPNAYPFQLSGGLNQRVMIAMALANEPFAA